MREGRHLPSCHLLQLLLGPIAVPQGSCFHCSLDRVSGRVMGAGWAPGSQVLWSLWGASCGLPFSFAPGPSGHRDCE